MTRAFGVIAVGLVVAVAAAAILTGGNSRLGKLAAAFEPASSSPIPPSPMGALSGTRLMPAAPTALAAPPPAPVVDPAMNDPRTRDRGGITVVEQNGAAPAAAPAAQPPDRMQASAPQQSPPPLAAPASPAAALPPGARWNPALGAVAPGNFGSTVAPAAVPAAPVPTYHGPSLVAPYPATAAAAPTSSYVDPLEAWGPSPAPLIDPRRFTEAHWQGMELIPKTPALSKRLGIPAEVRGVVLDDATLPADLQGFQAGDVITRLGQIPTPDLLSVIKASDQLRDFRQTEVEIFRSGQYRTLVLTALMDRLGSANGETPPMIQAGSRAPHGYQGPCTSCHRIGTLGQLAIDQGDALAKTAPPIRAGTMRPHQDRGPCTTCHQIVP